MDVENDEESAFYKLTKGIFNDFTKTSSDENDLKIGSGIMSLVSQDQID